MNTAEKIEQIAKIIDRGAFGALVPNEFLSAHSRFAAEQRKAQAREKALDILVLLQQGEPEGLKRIKLAATTGLLTIEGYKNALKQVCELVDTMLSAAPLPTKKETALEREAKRMVMELRGKPCSEGTVYGGQKLPATGAGAGNSATLEQVSKIVTAWSDETFGSPLTFQARDDLLSKLSPFLSPSRQAALEEAVRLTPAEIQSWHDRVKWAEGLILQLDEEHNGRNSWLLNYGEGKEAQDLRACMGKPRMLEETFRALATPPAGETE